MKIFTGIQPIYSRFRNENGHFLSKVAKNWIIFGLPDDVYYPEIHVLIIPVKFFTLSWSFLGVRDHIAQFLSPWTFEDFTAFCIWRKKTHLETPKDFWSEIGKKFEFGGIQIWRATFSREEKTFGNSAAQCWVLSFHFSCSKLAKKNLFSPSSQEEVLNHKVQNTKVQRNNISN